MILQNVCLKCLICTLVCVYSQAVTGLDLPSDEMKELQKKKLPEAIDNMYLIARRVQARFAQIPNRPVGFTESVFGNYLQVTVISGML